MAEQDRTWPTDRPHQEGDNRQSWDETLGGSTWNRNVNWSRQHVTGLRGFHSGNWNQEQGASGGTESYEQRRYDGEIARGSTDWSRGATTQRDQMHENVVVGQYQSEYSAIQNAPQSRGRGRSRGRISGSGRGHRYKVADYHYQAESYSENASCLGDNSSRQHKYGGQQFGDTKHQDHFFQSDRPFASRSRGRAAHYEVNISQPLEGVNFPRKHYDGAVRQAEIPNVVLSSGRSRGRHDTTFVNTNRIVGHFKHPTFEERRQKTVDIGREEYFPSEGHFVGRSRGRPFPTSEHAGREVGRTESKAIHEGALPDMSAMSLTQHDHEKGARSRIAKSITSGQSDPITEFYNRKSASSMRQKRIEPMDTIVTRPASINTKKGTFGQIVQLTANFFRLCPSNTFLVYQYKADFEPEIETINVRKSLLSGCKKKLGGFMFDGSILFTIGRREKDIEKFQTISTTTEQKFTISVSFVKELGVTDPQYLQLLAIIMRKCQKNLQLQQVGRNFYDPAAKQEMREKNLEIWPGYLTGIHQYEQDVMMCTEITHKVMRHDTAYELYQDICRNYGSERERQEYFLEAIIGSVVMTAYNNRTYRVDNVDFNVTPASTFVRQNGEISYCEYYEEKYAIREIEVYQPLLVSHSKPRELRSGMAETIYLVPSLCRLTGLTEQMRNNYQLMRSIADFTRLGPQQRVEKLIQFSERLLSVPAIAEDLKDWNMKLAPHLVTMQARVLGQQKIIQGLPGKEKIYLSGPRVDWTKELRASVMLSSAILDDWLIVVPSQHLYDTKVFMQTVMKVALDMGMIMNQPNVHEIQDERLDTYLAQLRYLLNKRKPKLVVCILPNKRAERYSAVKKLVCVEYPVPSQMIAVQTFRAKNPASIATKVAIQMNCKLGGQPWTVEIPIKSTVMVVGFDVTHDTKNKSKSYGAMVASLNSTFGRYYSHVHPHITGAELSDFLGTQIVQALAYYKSCNNGELPGKIIIYRDGVGDGQLPYVFHHEVVNIKDKLAKIYPNGEYKMAFIVVCKRIHTRLFTFNERNGYGNPVPGTVVDDVITLPERYDFFIVSQSVNQGTVTPTSYNVLHDNSGFSPDMMQRFTYKMTHFYFNWSGTVKVPAPVQYAHKLAYLAGQSLQGKQAGKDLETTLYFL